MNDEKGPRGGGANSAEQPSRRSMGSIQIVEGSPRRSEVPRDPRVAVSVSVQVRYESILDFHATQSLNLSRTGMFLLCANPRPVGTVIDFDFVLSDGLSLLKGRGEVVRVSGPPLQGMGVRFTGLDEDARKLIERIVQLNQQEGRHPQVPLDFAGQPSSASVSRYSPLRGATTAQPGLAVNGQDLQIKLSPATVGYFTNNPLLNIRLGGFVIPSDEEISLGATFNVSIESFEGHSLFAGRGKVVAKQEHRLGVRLTDADKTVLARLQAEILRLNPLGR